ncbi:MAG: hypothetical protein AB7U83_23415 [Vicinamibacterales bacterium]
MSDRIGRAVLELTTGGPIIADLQRLQREGRGVDTVFGRIGATLKRAVGVEGASAVGSVTSALTGLGRVAAGTFAGFLGAQAVMRGVGAVFHFARDAAFGLNATLETTELQFTTLMGDADRARDHVRGLFDFAAKTPFETGQVIEASRRLRTFGGDALDTADTLTAIGDAAAATGAPLEDLGTWVGRLYSSLMAGRPFGEAAQRLQELAVLSPAARTRLEEMQKAGQSGAAIFRAFQGDLAAFTGAMVSQANTWGGLTSSITDALQLAVADGFRPFFDTAKDGARLILQVLGSDGMGRVFESIKGQVAAAFGSDSQATVKAFAGGLIQAGQTGLTVADVLVRAWSGVQLVYAGTASVTSSLVLALLNLHDVALRLQEQLPGAVGAKYAALRQENEQLRRVFEETQRAFHEQAEGALAGVVGDSAAGRALASAREALAAFGAEIQRTSLAEEQAAAAGAKRPPQLDQQTAATRRLAEAEEKRAQALRAFYNELGEREIENEEQRLEAQAAAAKAAHERATAERALWNDIGVQRMEAEAAELERIDREAAAWREYLNWLGERRMEADAAAMGSAVSLGKVFKHVQETIRTQLGPTILAAFTGGGHAGKAAGGLLGGALMEGLLGDGKGGLGKLLTDKLGATLGGALGSVLPGLGTAIGGLLGGMADKVFGGLFGRGQHKKVNDLRDAFTKTAGGIHELNVTAQAAGLTLDRFLRAKTVQEYEAAVKELEDAFARLDRERQDNLDSANSLFDQIMEAGRNGIPASMRPTIEKLIELGLLTDEQIEKLRGLGDAMGPSTQQMEDALATIGGRIEVLGPLYQQQKLDETSMKYANAIQTLIDGGADVGGVLFDAREEISALVVEAVKAGKTLPANLKPWVEDLFNAGNLIDENGEKITDISGLQWGEAQKTEAQIAEEGWEKILAAIERLVTHIAGPLEDALDDVTRDRTINLIPKVGDINLDDYRGDDVARTQPVPFREGIFRGRFPAGGRLAALHNIESVVPRDRELGFVARVLSELSGRGGASITTNATNVLPVIMGQGLSPREIGRQAARYLAEAGLTANHADVTTRIEQVIERYLVTYPAAHHGAR